MEEIWNDLLSGPTDVYGELLRYYYKILGYDLVKKSQIMSDVDLASKEFRRIPSTPISEQICVKILEGFYDILKDSYGKKIATKYENNLKKILDRHNLRYILMQDCKMGLSLHGLLGSLLLRLKKSVQIEDSKLETLELLETNIAKLDNTAASSRNCMSMANNLMESAVVDKSTNRSKTLGRALRGCPDLFPYQTLFSSLENLNQFLNDYPNIRHSGNPTLRIRNLKIDDATLITALAITYASYIRSADDGFSIITGDF